MAQKKSFFGTLLKLGGIAAATAAVYYKREEIRDFLTDLAETIAPERPAAEPKPVEAEPEIIIDTTDKCHEVSAEECPKA